MAVKLDVKDKKILEQLDLNCRQSNSQISKIVGLSKDIVGYRIKNLEKQKIILGYYSVLNITKLGYVAYKVMLTFKDTTSKIEEEIINYLKKNKNVGWLVSCDGYYNLMVVVWVEDSFIFEKFFLEFLKKYSKYLKERDILVITENHACRKSYLYDKKIDNLPDVFYGDEKKSRLDENELKIINFLANNSRIKLHKIAESLNLTGEAIAYRVRQLQKKEIVQSFRPIINSSLLGYEYYNVLFKLKKFNRVKEIFGFFKKSPNIIYFVKYIGNYDVGIDLEVRNAQELRK
ncbi:MAG TPA: AsnC family transcriptional regulator, partial [Candidatus Nanoarchaeia archaeon]|nr:AsnC family transcriptional regulator [Candidatus Nanoarchaeia archaeon]